MIQGNDIRMLRRVASGWWADDLTLISESGNGLNGKLETLGSETPESKMLRVNVMKMRESLGKARKFLSAVCRICTGFNFIFCQGFGAQEMQWY